jgi:photosystem II stability/assembly factor-like uncharacterized protein
MLQQGMRLAVAVVAVLSASVVCADFSMDTLDLEVTSTNEVDSNALYVDVLDTPAAMTPLASRSLLNGIARAGKRLVAVGARGHILYSDDEGKSWKQARVPVSSDLTAVNFPTPQQGWAVGHDGIILHSSDGGVNWIKQFDGRAALQVIATRYKDAIELAPEIDTLVKQGPDKPFLDVWFDNDKTGYVVGSFNLVFRTDDGGATWDPWLDRTDNPKRLHLYAMRRIGDGLFIAGEQGLLLKFDPQQKKFVSLKCSYNGTFFGITGKPGVLVAFGLRGNAYRSLNGGASWQKIDTGVPTTLTGGTITKDGRIVLVTLLGTLLVSQDNGATFSPGSPQQGLPASAITETETGSLALVGMLGVWAQAAK